MSLILTRSDSRVVFDGAMGTEFERRGYSIERGASVYSVEEPDVLLNIHLDYLKAGADILTTNTLTANEYFLSQYQFDYLEVIKKSIKIACDAVIANGKGAVAQVIGPCGYLIKDDIDDKKLAGAFESQIIDGSNDVQFILIETMYLYHESMVALIAVKNSIDKPVIVTLVLDGEGKTFDGVSIEDASKALEMAGASAVGINCVEISDDLFAIIEQITRTVKIPIVLRPNLGKPIVKDNVKIYTKSTDEFIAFMRRASEMGVSGLGGCCGTTPEHIKEVKKITILNTN